MLQQLLMIMVDSATLRQKRPWIMSIIYLWAKGTVRPSVISDLACLLANCFCVMSVLFADCGGTKSTPGTQIFKLCKGQHLKSMKNMQNKEVMLILNFYLQRLLKTLFY